MDHTGFVITVAVVCGKKPFQPNTEGRGGTTIALVVLTLLDVEALATLTLQLPCAIVAVMVTEPAPTACSTNDSGVTGGEVVAGGVRLILEITRTV